MDQMATHINHHRLRQVNKVRGPKIGVKRRLHLPEIQEKLHREEKRKLKQARMTRRTMRALV